MGGAKVALTLSDAFCVDRHRAEFRALIADGTKSATTFSWVFLFPAGVLVLILVCANLTGDGLRDAFDPGSANLRARRHPKKST